MVDFIDKSLVRNAPNEAKISPYVPLIDAMLKDIATRLRDSTGDENKYLDLIDVLGHKARSESDIEKSELQFVTRLFRQWDGHGALPFGQIKLTLEVIGSYFPIIAFGLLRRELIPGTFTGPKNFSIGNAHDNSDDAFTLGPEFDPDYLANQLYYPGTKGNISYSIKWAVIFTRYRRELAEELHRVNHNRAVLVTPALVDFTKWLDASSNKVTAMADQVALMGRLSREIRQGQPHIHGFVAFDPLRQAIYDKLGGAPDASPLAIIDKAITQGGFIGVKLYPPMGFRATSNAAAGDDFPCWVRFGSGSPGYGEKCVNPKNTADGLGNAPGQILDDVLDRLYACVSPKRSNHGAHQQLE